LNTSTGSTTRAADTQHWAGKAPSLSKGKWLKRALGAALKRDSSKGVSEANKRAYDLILMDISMPNMDGIAAAAKIRGESVYNKATPIYALTAHANHQDRERFQKEGMNECILKPISKSIIADILAEIEVSTVHS